MSCKAVLSASKAKVRKRPFYDKLKGNLQKRPIQRSLITVFDPRYILGGIHMTNPAFLPNSLLKEITGTEYNRTKIPSFFNDNHNLTELERQQARIFGLANKPNWLKRIDPVSSATDIVGNLPWWLECNPARYPYWFGQTDPRNELLLKAMQSGSRHQKSNTLKISDIIK